MEFMVGFLKRKSVKIVMILLSLSILGVFLIYQAECSYTPSSRVITAINNFNKISKGSYKASVDKCYPEIHIAKQNGDEVDSVLIHEFFIKINYRKPTCMINVYDRYGVLLYVEYAILRGENVHYYRVKQYEY